MSSTACAQVNKVSFFGDLVLGETDCNEKSAARHMLTAIFTIYTPQGWVIAADGLGMLSDGSNPDNDVQKIFQIEGRSLAYTLCGSTKLFYQENLIDFGSEIANAVKALACRNLCDSSLYLERICSPLRKSLLRAKKQGLVMRGIEVPPEPGQTIFWVFLIGYFDGKPTLAHCRIFHRNQKLAGISADADPVKAGWSRRHGPNKVWEIREDPHDRTFETYKIALPTPGEITLVQGIESARNHIQVCYDPKAREIAPETCKTIGGHMHVATITPETGFEWVEPPKSQLCGGVVP